MAKRDLKFSRIVMRWVFGDGYLMEMIFSLDRIIQ